jgi:hypothetical protein
MPDVFSRLLSFRIRNLLCGFEIFGTLSLLSVAVQPMLILMRGPAKLKDGFKIMFRLLYTASERVAKRAGFCVDCWLRSLLATPLRFEPYHDVFPS